MHHKNTKKLPKFHSPNFRKLVLIGIGTDQLTDQLITDQLVSENSLSNKLYSNPT